MTRVLLALGVFVLIILAVAQWKSSQPEEPVADHEQLYQEFLAESLVRAQQYAIWFLDGELEALHDGFTAEMKLLFPIEDLVELRARIKAELGEEVLVVEESLSPMGENFVYGRISRYSNSEMSVQLRITLNDEMKILGFTIQPASSSEETPQEENDS